MKTVEAIVEGDWKGAAMGFGEALLDGVLLVTTGGIGNIAKVGAKTAIKIIAKETLENYVSGKVSDGLSDAGISPLGQVALGVVLGIRPKGLLKKNVENFRENLRRLTGQKPDKDVHAHHIFPKELAEIC